MSWGCGTFHKNTPLHSIDDSARNGPQEVYYICLRSRQDLLYKLKSGGPKMTVTKVESWNAVMSAHCEWFDGSKQGGALYPLIALKLVDQAASSSAGLVEIPAPGPDFFKAKRYRIRRSKMFDLTGWNRVFVVLAISTLCAPALMAQTQNSDRLDTKSLEAAASFAQSLAQWEFALIGGSLLVLFGTSYRHPPSRQLRTFYFLFLVGWLCLAWSIHMGAQAQGAYLAYLLVPAITIHDATRQLNEDIGREMLWMFYGLGAFFIWLLLYLVWWVFFNVDTERQTSP